MRTTLTLEDDVAVRLKRLARRRALRFKHAVNEALRAGLDALDSPPPSKPYTTPTFSLGLRPGLDRDKLGQLADELADQDKLKSLS
jgi:hypothetical protein